MGQGFVALVGAGPGELGLLTLKAKECIEKADVVVYDRLVSSEILDLIPSGAKKLMRAKMPETTKLLRRILIKSFLPRHRKVIL